MKSFDVVVIGAGNAGLAAAVAARQYGARVCVLERAAYNKRGGNSSLTRNIRFPYTNWTDLTRLVPNISSSEEEYLADTCHSPYTEEQMIADWLRIAGPTTPVTLMQLVVGNGQRTIAWMHRMGHRWTVQANPLPGALQIGLLGGGEALQQTWFRVAAEQGVELVFDAHVTHLEPSLQERGWTVRIVGGRQFCSTTVIIASGGFQANKSMRINELGEAWGGVHLRGTDLNDGTVMLAAMNIGAQRAGDWTSCHAVPYSQHSPDHVDAGGIKIAHTLTRYSYPFGIMVNALGRRFVDEASDFGNLTYARLGREIVSQPNGQAIQIFGGEALRKLPRAYLEDDSTRVADTLDELAHHLDLNPHVLREEISQVNSALRSPGGDANSLLSVPRTPTIGPLKPPYLATRVACGLTFTFGGLSIDSNCRVQNAEESPIPGLYACGETIGGLYTSNYPGGVGLLAGAVLGRRAGRDAARESCR